MSGAGRRLTPGYHANGLVTMSSTTSIRTATSKRPISMIRSISAIVSGCVGPFFSADWSILFASGDRIATPTMNVEA